MLFAGWKVHMVKNCDLGLENAAQGAGQGQHFQAQGHSFSPYGPTLATTLNIIKTTNQLSKLSIVSA